MENGIFREAFLVGAEFGGWPNNLVFVVWSPLKHAAYRIIANVVLEFHFLRTGTIPLPAQISVPLDNIFLTYEEEYEFWLDRIKTLTKADLDNGAEPQCIEFSSSFFANRTRKTLVRDRNMGALVVCREYHIEVLHTYTGPRPNTHHIPAGTNT